MAGMGAGAASLKDRLWAQLGDGAIARPSGTRKGQSESRAGAGRVAHTPAEAAGNQGLPSAEWGHERARGSLSPTSCLLLGIGVLTVKTHFSGWGCTDGS